MDPSIMKSFSDHLLFGGALVAAGSAAGLWLPLGAAVLLSALLWGRIAWIEQTIVRHGDEPPHLRQRARAWAAFAWAVAAGAALHAVVPLTIAAGTVALFLALRQADCLALGALERQSSPSPVMAQGEEAAPAAFPRRRD